MSIELSLPWREAFEQAWEAYRARSVPCGSVITDRSGTIVTRGRNRTRESEGPRDQLVGTGLGHAETNAIVGLPTGLYPDHTLYSTLEPCLLCLGAGWRRMKNLSITHQRRRTS